MEKTPITAEQMRHYDSYTINTIGIPSLVLMERAALAVRDEVLNACPLYLGDRKDRKSTRLNSSH